MKLIGKQIILRELRKSDAEDLRKNINDRKVIRFMTHVKYPFSKKDALKLIEGKKLTRAAKTEFAFGIALKSTNKIIGGIDLHHIDLKNKNSELGYWLGKKYWNKGIMTEAVKLAVDFGFRKLKLHRVYANLFHKNIASKKILEKIGFTLEGNMREKRWRENQWHNVLNFGILGKEYKKRK